jgi:streptomycin 6-kinase
VTGITIPPQLAHAVEEDDLPKRFDWLAALPDVVEEIAEEWHLELGEPYLPGGQCAWVAPARNKSREDLVLKVHWRHREAEHEADALRFWDGNGAVRCFAAKTLDHTTLLLLERCDPGVPLNTLPEPEQDVVIAELMRRLWERTPEDGHPFIPFQDMCDLWADSLERKYAADPRGLDPGLAREGSVVMRELPRSADRAVLLCTDLHAGNVLSSRREPWLVIDPKPFIGDPAFDPLQHMFNCEERLAADPVGLVERMAELADVDPERVRLWLFARAVQEFQDPEMRELAGRLASSTR